MSTTQPALDGKELPVEVKTNKQISMILNGTKLTLNNKGKWDIESSDLDLATLEIERLLDEKEQLCNVLSRAMQQIEDLQQEVRDLNKVKSTTLEMVIESYRKI